MAGFVVAGAAAAGFVVDAVVAGHGEWDVAAQADENPSRLRATA
jgi:hypothetical protein